jgi:hypothetical protein
MEAHTDPDIEPGTSAAEVAADHQSVLDRIKKRRDETEDFLVIDIPSWDGDLKAKYKVLDRDYVEKMIRRIRARTNGAAASGIEAEADFLIDACVEIIGYDAEEDKQFHVGNGYDLELATALNPTYPASHPMAGEPVNISHPRELVVYMLKWNGLALAAHAQSVARWMQNLKRPVEDPQ